MSRKLLDLTGQVFDHLTVLRQHHESGQTRWACRCVCGQETVVRSHNLRSGKTKSCGCSQHAKTPRPIKPPTTTIPPRPLGLSDVQLETILNHSWVIEPLFRSRFLSEVSDQLLGKESVSDHEVERACYTVALRMRSTGRKGSDKDDRELERRLA